MKDRLALELIEFSSTRHVLHGQRRRPPAGRESPRMHAPRWLVSLPN